MTLVLPPSLLPGVPTAGGPHLPSDLPERASREASLGGTAVEKGLKVGGLDILLWKDDKIR